MSHSANNGKSSSNWGNCKITAALFQDTAFMNKRPSSPVLPYIDFPSFVVRYHFSVFLYENPLKLWAFGIYLQHTNRCCHVGAHLERRSVVVDEDNVRDVILHPPAHAALSFLPWTHYGTDVWEGIPRGSLKYGLFLKKEYQSSSHLCYQSFP